MNQFERLAWWSLILVYLVIAAGSIVRMTGSGMGCPDWPKCFGYWIPPTEEQALLWQENREFEAGQVIIRNEELKVAKEDFTTGETYAEENWEDYTRHDYAEFNVWHTWIEYINRLLGALAGLATLLLALRSFSFWGSFRRYVYLSWAVVFGMAFQGWLGATVVYSVLNPYKITLHMFMALVIVCLLLTLIHFQKHPLRREIYPQPFPKLFLLSLVLTAVQIYLGTQVREYVDDQVEFMGYYAQDQWLAQPEWTFYVHRSLSLLVVALNFYLWWAMKKLGFALAELRAVLFLIFAEIVLGIALYYFDFPFSTQPLHLVLASALFGLQYYLWLAVSRNRASRKSL